MNIICFNSIRKRMLARQGRSFFSLTQWLLMLSLTSFNVAAFAVDQDGDGVLDVADNCIEVANPGQRDSDGDGYGNFCDADLDGNLLVNMADFILLRNRLNSQDPDADFNGDGIVNAVDFIMLRNQLNSPPGPSCCEAKTVGNGQLKISFQKTGDGVNVSGIANGNNEILNITSQNEIFSLFITNTADNISESITSLANWGGIDIALLNDNADCRITFSSPIQGDLPSTLVATVSIKTAGSKSEWDLTVTGLGNSHSLNNVNFPHLNINAPGDDQFLIPKYSGQLISNPASEIDYTGLYPRGWGSTMQFLAYYNDSYGIYFGFHDPSAARKTFRVVNEAGGIKMEGQLSIPDMTLAGNDWEMPGHFELDLFNGDWYEASQIYKAWASASADFWPQDTPERSVRQANIGGIGAWLFLSEPDHAAVNIQRFMQLFINTFPGIQVGIHWYQWNNLVMDNDYPNYFPEKDGAIALIENIQNNNEAYVMPYTNGRLWDSDLAGGEFDFDLNGLASAAKINRSNNDYFFQNFNGNHFAVMCPTQTPWQNVMVDVSDQITDRMGAMGMYFDQVAAASSVECMDPSHGHTLGGGGFWRDGYSEMLDKVHAQLPAGRFVAVEGGSDYIIDKVDGFLTEGWQTSNLVPAFLAVYSGEVQLFGTSAGGGSYNTPAFYSKFAQSFSYGIQPGRFFLGLVASPQNVATAIPFVRRLATLRTKLKDFMSFGVMQKPLPVNGNIPDITTTWRERGFGDEIEVTISAIQSSIWQREDGSIAVVFVNASMTDGLGFSFNFDGSQYGLNGQLHIQEVTETSDGAMVNVNSAFTQNATLPAMGAVAYIITQ